MRRRIYWPVCYYEHGYSVATNWFSAASADYRSKHMSINCSI